MIVDEAFVPECSVVEAAAGLSDRELTRCVADCAARERQSLAGLLGFLAEFDARDLHEPAGFDALYEKYAPFVWRTLRGFGVASGDIDDAVQEVSLTALFRDQPAVADLTA